MIRIDAIPATGQRRSRFRPFTSGISAAALAGLYLGLISQIFYGF